MSARSAAVRGQKRAESLMADTCTISRITIERVGGIDQPVSTPIYTGKCKVQLQTIAASNAQEVGGAVITQTTRRVDLPMSAPEVEVNDLVDITTSLDPQLVGKTFRVTSRFGKTFATARRLEVKEP